MKRSKTWLMLFVVLTFVQVALGQDYTRHNWFFGDSQYGIIFNKSDDQPNQVDTQATPFGSAGAANS